MRRPPPPKDILLFAIEKLDNLLNIYTSGDTKQQLYDRLFEWMMHMNCRRTLRDFLICLHTYLKAHTIDTIQQHLNSIHFNHHFYYWNIGSYDAGTLS